MAGLLDQWPMAPTLVLPGEIVIPPETAWLSLSPPCRRWYRNRRYGPAVIGIASAADPPQDRLTDRHLLWGLLIGPSQTSQAKMTPPGCAPVNATSASRGPGHSRFAASLVIPCASLRGTPRLRNAVAARSRR